MFPWPVVMSIPGPLLMIAVVMLIQEPTLDTLTELGFKVVPFCVLFFSYGVRLYKSQRTPIHQ